MQIEISDWEFHEHRDGCDGVCLSCGAWTCGDVEPDAEGYECDACGASDVMGAEQALLMGHIVLNDDEGVTTVDL